MKFGEAIPRYVDTFSRTCGSNSVTFFATSDYEEVGCQLMTAVM